jgi:hypothetical protein
MERRNFGKTLLAAAAGVSLCASTPAADGAQAAAPQTRRKNLKMHVSTDYHVVEGKEFVSKENFDYNLRFGVSHINPDPVMIAAGSGPPKVAAKSGWGDFIAPEGPQAGAFDLDALKRMRDACDAAGITVEGFRMDSGYIVMKPGPDRERKLDQVCENIRLRRSRRTTIKAPRARRRSVS